MIGVKDSEGGSGIVLSPLSTARVCSANKNRLKMKGVMMRKMMFLGFLKVMRRFLKVSRPVCEKKLGVGAVGWGGCERRLLFLLDSRG